MAFAVRDAAKALDAYTRYLHVPADTAIEFFPKSKN
jgi:methylmalonyl-CoA/ethylmalonyl-CoA epimerase